MVAQVWSATRFLRLVGDHLVWVADPSSCCCVSFPLVPVSVCPSSFCVCCLSLCRSFACFGSFCSFFGSAVGFCCDVFAPFPPGLEILFICSQNCLHRSFSDFPCFQGLSVSSPLYRRHRPQGTAFSVVSFSFSHGWSVGMV